MLASETDQNNDNRHHLGIVYPSAFVTLLPSLPLLVLQLPCVSMVLLDCFSALQGVCSIYEHTIPTSCPNIGEAPQNFLSRLQSLIPTSLAT